MTHIYLLAILILSFNCMIIDWEKGTVHKNSSVKIDFRTPMYSLADAPFGKEAAFIGLDLKFQQEKNLNSKVLLFVFNSEAVPKTDDLCLLNDVPPHRVTRNSIIKMIVLDNNHKTVEVKETLTVNKTGIYLFQVHDCSPTGSFLFEGKVTWKNPFGYLPGNTFSKLPFTFTASILYTVLFIFFVVNMILYRTMILRLQYCIFVVIFLTMVSYLTWSFYRLHNNNDGYYRITTLIFAVAVHVTFSTVIRVLILLVSQGYGVAKWTLGNTVSFKLSFLAFFYFVFEFIHMFEREVSAVGTYQTISTGAKFAILIPYALLETTFFYWIILSLIRTIQQLILRRQDLKLKMYKIFLGVLVFVGVISIAYAFYSFFGYDISRDWKFQWIVDGVIDIIVFIVLSSICILWRPRTHNVRYGAESLTKNDRMTNTHEDDIAITTIEEFVYQGGRKRNKSVNNSPKGSSNEKQSSDREEYDISRERTREQMGFNPADVHTALEQTIMDIEIDDDDNQGIMDEISKID